MKFSEYIGSQFGEPRGPVGKICCLIMNRINRAMYKNILMQLGTKKYFGNKNILDIGCGNGYMIKKLYRRTGADIYGTDISEDMVLAAKKRNKKAVDKGKLSVSQGDVCTLDFESGSMDIVTSVNTIYFWNSPQQGMEETCRVLKKGGVFYNAVYSKQWLQKLSYTKKGFRFFELEDYAELGRKAGFSKVTINETVRGKSFCITYIK